MGIWKSRSNWKNQCGRRWITKGFVYCRSWIKTDFVEYWIFLRLCRQKFVRLPLYSCPFKGCSYATKKRYEYLLHVGGTEAAAQHFKVIKETCGKYLHLASPLDFVYLAMSYAEREKFPLIGPTVTRRALRTLTTVYNDEEDGTKALICFCCAQIDVTIKGPDVLRYANNVAFRGDRPKCNRIL